MTWWNPWRDIREARDAAETLRALAQSRARMIGDVQADVAVLRQQVGFVTIERDAARRELDAIHRAKSAAISRGNRTRALRRRGALAPEPIDNLTGREANHRTQRTG